VVPAFPPSRKKKRELQSEKNRILKLALRTSLAGPNFDLFFYLVFVLVVEYHRERGFYRGTDRIGAHLWRHDVVSHLLAPS
jgi:hypothetical protein